MIAALVVFAFSFVVSFILAKVIDMTMGMRIDEEQEEIGMDLALHAEAAYAFGEVGTRA